MKKRPDLSLKCLAGLMSAAMIFSSAPFMQVHAEDVIPEGEGAAVFVITNFKDFEENPDGTFQNSDMEEEYGALEALPGTLPEELGLPDSLNLEGYWESDGADVPSTYELRDFDWKLKNDTGESYTETSPEGIYLFVPDLDTYVWNTDGIDEFRLAENVKMLDISVLIAPEILETEFTTELLTEAYTEFYEEPITEAFTEPITEAFTEPVTETYTEPVTEAFTEPVSEEDIFSELDPSALDSDSGGEVIIYNPNETPGAEPPTEPVTEPLTELITEAPTESITEPATEAPTEPVTEAAVIDPVGAPAEPMTEPISESEIESVASETVPVAPVNDPAAPSTLKIRLSLNGTDGNPVFSSGDHEVTLTSSLDSSVPETNVLTISELPCGTDLTALGVSVAHFEDTNASALSVVPAETQDFSVQGTKTFTLTESDEIQDTTYPFTLAVSKQNHTWDAASCSSNQHCTVCNAENPNSALAHTWTPANCTTPDICEVCGETKGEALGHDWKDATCTDPRTCKRCSTTEGTALGHDWKAATCTDPRTCKRCGATEGKALGHDMSGNWEQVSASTDSTHGEEIRYCNRGCGHSETRPLNIIGSPDGNAILDLANGGQYNLNTKISFTASGSGMANGSPINGDVRFVPTSWNIQNTPGAFQDNFTGSFAISKAGTYTVTVSFQKQIYEDGWASTNITDTKSVSFNVGNLVQGTPVDGSGIRINPQTGDSTPIIPLVCALAAALLIIVGVVIYRKKKK